MAFGYLLISRQLQLRQLTLPSAGSQGGVVVNLSPTSGTATTTITYPLSGSSKSFPFAIATYTGVVASVISPTSSGFTITLYFARATDQTNARWYAFVL